jgi:uncharacterized OB-fold protein
MRIAQPQAPFTVAETQLDDGPLIRGTLGHGTGQLQIGDTVTAVWASEAGPSRWTALPRRRPEIASVKPARRQGAVARLVE